MEKQINKQNQGVPEPTLRRLTTYLVFLKNIKESGKELVSAPFIAEELKFDATQVTKDLAYTGIVGKTRVGYEINSLIKVVEEFLGYNRTDLAFLVGTGNLGSALLKYNGFNETGLKIVAAFDTDPDKVKTTIGDVEIFHLDKFRNLAERLHVRIGIITTPATVAQSVADLMVGWGIKAIWNFSPLPIRVPENIIVENTSIYSNLAVMINKLHQMEKKNLEPID